MQEKRQPVNAAKWVAAGRRLSGLIVASDLSVPATCYEGFTLVENLKPADVQMQFGAAAIDKEIATEVAQRRHAGLYRHPAVLAGSTHNAWCSDVGRVNGTWYLLDSVTNKTYTVNNTTTHTISLGVSEMETQLGYLKLVAFNPIHHAVLVCDPA